MSCGLFMNTIAQRQKAQRGQCPLVIGQRQTVGGNLLDDESIVGQILVERANDVVAIGIGPGKRWPPRTST